tara:strand:+ start:8368 stop:10272 length:1905 start_codon:yes stop_codon:yes gene_type:complete
MWQKILKSNPLTQGMLEAYLMGAYDLEDYVSFSETIRNQSISMYNGLIDSLELFEKDKNKYLNDKNYKRFPNAMRKMNALLAKIDTRKRRSDEGKISLALEEAYQKANSEPNSKNLKDFMNLYKKHIKTSEKVVKFRNFIKKIKSDLPYVVVRFRESEKINAKDKRVVDFIEETAGKYASESVFGGIFGDFEIHYENMGKADDWFRVWNNFSKEADNAAIVDYIKSGKPEVNIKSESYSLPESKKYKVNLTIDNLQTYFDLIDRSKISRKRFIPDKIVIDGRQIQLSGLKNLLGTTGTGKSFSFSPFMQVLLESDISSTATTDWFTNLINRTRISQIITPSQIKFMVRNDLKDAKKKGLRRTPLFGIDVDSVKGFEEADQDRLIDELNLSRILSEQREQFRDSYFISEETKEIVEEELALGMKLPEGVSDLTFRPSIVEGYYIMQSDGADLDSVTRVRKILQDSIGRLTARKNKDKDEKDDAFTIELDNITNLVYSLDDFESLYAGREKLDESARRHNIGNTRLSSFSAEDVISLFYVLDRELGDDTVASYYKQIDNADDILDREDLIEDLKDHIEESLPKFRSGIAQSFAFKLSTILDKGIVSNEDAGKGVGKGKLPQNIFNGLVTRGIIEEA